MLYAFVDDPGVPGTNNAAEQAVRPLKTKQKRSGRFRTRAGLGNHVRLAGYMDTVRKHGQDPLEALTRLAAENPWLPTAEQLRPRRAGWWRRTCRRELSPG